MKRTDNLTKVLAFVLFAAFVIYAAAYAYRALSASTVTADTVLAEVKLGGVATGIVIREESVLTSSEKYVDVVAKDGARVAVGAPLATAMSSQQGLLRATRIHELELEISRMTAALRELDTAEDLTARDESLRASVAAITAAVARHELSDLDADALNLRSLLFRSSGEQVTQADLTALQRELDTMKSSTDGDAVDLTALRSGTFSTVVDGYEYLTPAALSGLTPSALETLMDAPHDIPAGAYGKLVTSHRWYFAAVMDVRDAAKLELGRSATLNFDRWYGSDVQAVVTDIGRSEQDRVAVTFRCDTALADTLAMRKASANVVFETYSGIRVPQKALHTDPETDQLYVWAVTAMQLERKDVEVLYQADDYAIVALGNQADVLRAGNTVVVKGSDLYEGKVLE